MEIRICLYEVTDAEEGVSEDYFDLDNYNSREDTPIKYYFKDYVQERDHYDVIDIAYGCPDLEVAERLNEMGLIDITNGANVIIERDLNAFRDYCLKEIQSKYNDQVIGTSIYEIDFSARERLSSALYLGSIFNCYIKIPRKCETLYATWLDEVKIDVNEKFIEDFEEYFIYCKKEDIKLMKVHTSEAEKNSLDSIIEKFSEKESFVTVEFLESLPAKEQKGKYSLLEVEKKDIYRCDELVEIESKMLDLERELNKLDKKRLEILDAIIADVTLSKIFDLEYGTMNFKN